MSAFDPLGEVLLPERLDGFMSKCRDLFDESLGLADALSQSHQLAVPFATFNSGLSGLVQEYNLFTLKQEPKEGSSQPNVSKRRLDDAQLWRLQTHQLNGLPETGDSDNDVADLDDGVGVENDLVLLGGEEDSNLALLPAGVVRIKVCPPRFQVGAKPAVSRIYPDQWCAVCGMKIKGPMRNLVKHVQRIHIAPPRITLESSKRKKRRQFADQWCAVCGKKIIGNWVRMREHIHRCHMPRLRREFKCSVCSKNLDSLKTYQNHMELVHLTKREFICNVCGFQAHRQKNLWAHKQCHVTPHVACNFEGCGRVFKRSDNMRAHFRLVHAKDTFANTCDLCGKSFRSPCHLRRHLGTHSDEKTCLCSLCGTSFKRIDYLQNHMKKVHKLGQSIDLSVPAGEFLEDSKSHVTKTKSTDRKPRRKKSQHKAPPLTDPFEAANQIAGTSVECHVIKTTIGTPTMSNKRLTSSWKSQPLIGSFEAANQIAGTSSGSHVIPALPNQPMTCRPKSYQPANDCSMPVGYNVSSDAASVNELLANAVTSRAPFHVPQTPTNQNAVTSRSLFHVPQMPTNQNASARLPEFVLENNINGANEICFLTSNGIDNLHNELYAPFSFLSQNNMFN